MAEQPKHKHKNGVVEKFDSFMPRPGNRAMFQLIPIGVSGLLCGLLGWRLGGTVLTGSDALWFVLYFVIALSIAYTVHWMIYILVIQAHYKNLMAYAEKLSDLSLRCQMAWDAQQDEPAERAAHQPPSSRQLH